MFRSENLSAYREAVGALLHHPDVQSMHRFGQHAKGISRLDHSIYVSYLSFIFCRRLKLDAISAARAGLMHDMDLDGGAQIGAFRQLFAHPVAALHSARAHGLNEVEANSILGHMWPITPRLRPRYKESYVVNLADKISTILEVTRMYRMLRVSRHLSYSGLGAQMKSALAAAPFPG